MKFTVSRFYFLGSYGPENEYAVVQADGADFKTLLANGRSDAELIEAAKKERGLA